MADTPRKRQASGRTARHEPDAEPEEVYEEEEYEDEGEYAEEEEEEESAEVHFTERMNIWLRRSPAVLISAAFHLIVLAILATIVYQDIKPEVKAVLMAKREPKRKDYDDKLKRSLHKTPKINAEEIVEKPIIILEEEVEITKDIPKGTDLNNLSNKNLEGKSVVDAFGVGGGGAGAYGQRFGRGSLSNEGGSPGTEAAVLAALYWLRDHQAEDGRWDIDAYAKACGKAKIDDKPRQGKCEGPGGANDQGVGFSQYDVGVTAMATLAFLGHGSTHRVGEFKFTVKKAVDFLKSQQKVDGPLAGAIGFDPSDPETIYNHAIATMAVCEALAVSRDFMLKKHAQAAVEFCLRAQNIPVDETDPKALEERAMGWKYGIQPGKSDTSVTGWMVLALKAAVVARIDVPKIAFIGARNWFDRCFAPDGQVGYASNNPPKSSVLEVLQGKFGAVPCMTGVAAICRIFTGDKKTDPKVRKSRDFILRDENLPSFEPKDWQPGQAYRRPPKSPVNFYYWYYATYAVFQSTESGSREWKKWNKAMQEAILPFQHWGQDACSHQDGAIHCLDGSWDPVDEWGLAGGRVYATAINALTLEIYYRYARSH